MHNTYDNLRELVEKEMHEISKRGELDETTLAYLYKLVDIAKDIGEIEDQESGYSGRYYPYMMDSRGRSYNNGYSMRNRDSMGRYSRNYSNNSYRGYSGDDMMAKLEHMMDTAGSEAERQTIQRIMSQM